MSESYIYDVCIMCNEESMYLQTRYVCTEPTSGG